jgi:aminopeptidase S
MRRHLIATLALVGLGLSTTAPALADALVRHTVPIAAERDVMPHVAALQAIADRHGGNRAFGTPGFAASLHYVRSVLDRAGYRTEVHRFEHAGKQGYNLIADWPGGDEARTVFVGAHLDSVPEGPGMNDNASGTAAVLATAVAVAKEKPRTAEHLRFGFWDAEELGLVGSGHYLRSLTPAQRERIQVYLNFDMTGTPDNDYWLVSDLGNEASAVLKDHFADRNLPVFEVGAGGSDHEKFAEYGVAVSGFSTGLDDCYHQPCDRIDRLSWQTEVISTNAIIAVTWALATR